MTAAAWLDLAACRGELDFTEWPAADQAARCARCPVRFECLDLGVGLAPTCPASTIGFGGRSAVEVTVLARARRKGQPLRIRHCVVCGCGFETRSSVARYCSGPCRQRAYQRRSGGAR